MAVTPSTGMSDSDIYFNIEDDILRETLRQLFDNTRKLNDKIEVLKGRVIQLEEVEVAEAAEISFQLGTIARTH